MTTRHHTAIATGESNAPSTLNTRLSGLDAAIGDLSGTGVSGASAAAQIAATKSRIDNLGVEAGNANAEVTAARSTGFVASSASNLSQRLDWVEGRVVNAFAYHSTGTLGTAATDTAAIQAAIDALPSTGGTVLLPNNGTAWSVNATITIEKPCRLIGQGTKITAASGWSGAMIFFDGTDNCTVDGFVIDGLYSTRTNGDGVFVRDCTNVWVQNCVFQNIPTTGVSITRGSYVWVQNCTFDSVYLSGVRWNTPTAGANRYLWVDSCHFYDVNVAEQGGNGSVAIAGGSVTNEYVWITNNYVSYPLNGSHPGSPRRIGFAIDKIDGCVITNNRMIGDTYSGEAIAITGNNVTVRGNHINNWGAAGILLYIVDADSENTVISNNVCYDNNNGLEIVFASDSVSLVRAIIEGNICYNTGTGPAQQYGLQVYNSGTRSGTALEHTSVVNNTFVDNSTGAYNFSTSPVNYRAQAIVQANRVDDTGIQNTSTKPYSSFFAQAGAADATSDQLFAWMRHLDEGASGSGSTGEISVGFSSNSAIKKAGLRAVKEATTANRVGLRLFCSNGSSTPVEVAKGDARTDGNGGFGPTSSAWNGAHLFLGSYHLWVDATGDLRIKSSAPTSDTDGTIVGTQS